MGEIAGLDLSLSPFPFSAQPDGVGGPRIPWVWTEPLYVGPERVWGCGGVEFVTALFVYDILKMPGFALFCHLVKVYYLNFKVSLKYRTELEEG